MPNDGEELIVKPKVDVALKVGGISLGLSLNETESVSQVRLLWK